MSTTPIISVTDLAWAGGFIDGEGCICIAKVKRNCGHRINYRLRVHVAQNCRTTLEELRRILGGAGYIFKIRRRLEHTRQIYSFVLDGQAAIDAIRTVSPYLRRKHGEAEVAIAFYARGDISGHPGPKGASAEIWKFRKWCDDKLRKMK